MNINELTKMKQSKYFYEKTEMFLETCDEIFDNLQSVLGSDVVKYQNDNESFYMEGVFFDIKNDRKWRDQLYGAINRTLTNFDYGLMNEILNTVIEEEALFLLNGKKFANHRVVVNDEIYVEMKHPLLQSFSKTGNPKSFLEYLKENDEGMYYNFFSDEEISTEIEESFYVPEIEAEKIKEWEQYIDEALTELGSYDNIYEDMKSELFNLVVDTAIKTFLGTLI